MASTPANNYDPVIIVDEKTANQVVYTWPRILRKDLKEAFGFTGYFTVITGERYLVKPDGETYELEHGTTYYIDGERRKQVLFHINLFLLRKPCCSSRVANRLFRDKPTGIVLNFSQKRFICFSGRRKRSSQLFPYS